MDVPGDTTDAELESELVARLGRIRLLCLDVDGVLSDGHLYFAGGADWQAMAPEARWTQRFSVRDGVGIKLLQQAGGQERRGGIEHAFLGQQIDVVDLNPIPGLTAEHFADEDHLNNLGKELFTRALSATLPNHWRK